MRLTGQWGDLWFSGGGFGLASLLALVGLGCQSPAVTMVPPPCPVMSLKAIPEMFWRPGSKPYLELWISETERYCDGIDAIQPGAQ